MEWVLFFVFFFLLHFSRGLLLGSDWKLLPGPCRLNGFSSTLTLLEARSVRGKDLLDESCSWIPSESVERMRQKLGPSNFERWISITQYAGIPQAVELLRKVVSTTPDGVVYPDLFHALFPFSLDGFQLEALAALSKRKNVVVSAPTGSGKTVAGELAIYYALALGLRVFYTSPLKALSNQKFKDFQNQFGRERVGLLTGDTSIQREAQVCVMTTEVFRNMLYEEDEELLDVFAVVFDEFHYMNDPERGTVWEESVINCPPHMLIIALSATMRNVDEIAGWFTQVHGPSQLISSNFRPVPLSYYFANNKGIFPLFKDPKVGPGAPKGVLKRRRNKGRASDPMELNPELLGNNMRPLPKILEGMSPRDMKRAERAAMMKETPSGRFLIRCMKRADMLPAIIFIFSRVGCDKSVKECTADEVNWLISKKESLHIEEKIATFQKLYPQITIDEDRIAGLKQGIAAHHAGMLPAFKSLIEDLFNANLLKVLFATETLAAGVNMPARTTVISVLSKRGDNGIATLSPSNLLQMAGRAGRRGKDVAGSVVIVRSRFEDAKDAHKLLLSPIDRIKSQFRASYSMVANVLKNQDLEKSRALIEKSFGNYLSRSNSDSLPQDMRDAQDQLEEITSSLQDLDLNQAKKYRKSRERLQLEQKINNYLLAQLREQGQDVIESLLPYVQVGTGLLLWSTEPATLVGSCLFSGNDYKKVTVLTFDGILKVVHYDAVKMLEVGEHAGLPISQAIDAAQKLAYVVNWENEDENTWRGEILNESIVEQLKCIAGNMKVIEVPEMPGHILKQRKVIEQIEAEIKSNPIHSREDSEQILEWAKDVDELEMKIRQGTAFRARHESDQPAWEEFLSVSKILQKYNALNEYKPTDFGSLVGSINAENELWLALVLTDSQIDSLTPTSLAGVIAALMNEYVRKEQYIMYGASEAVEQFIAGLLPISEELIEEQILHGLTLPVRMDLTLSGLVESWVEGCSWIELCDSCSLDQGDLCRILRRTNEMLKQIVNLPLVSSKLKDNARLAFQAIDRFPVADDITFQVESKEKAM